MFTSKFGRPTITDFWILSSLIAQLLKKGIPVFMVVGGDDPVGGDGIGAPK